LDRQNAMAPTAAESYKSLILVQKMKGEICGIHPSINLHI
jgi:hypothetical protein